MREQLKFIIIMVGILLLVAARAAGMPFSYSLRSMTVSDVFPYYVNNTCYKDRSCYMCFVTKES